MEEAKALYYDLAERANSGDPEAQRQFRSLTRFDGHKTSVVSAVLQDGIIRQLASDLDFTSKTAVADEMNKMAKDLAGTNPNGLERMLAEQVVFTFMLMRIAESKGMSAEPEEQTPFEAEIARCENRYYTAVRHLAQVRKLHLPRTVDLEQFFRKLDCQSPLLQINVTK